MAEGSPLPPPLLPRSARRCPARVGPARSPSHPPPQSREGSARPSRPPRGPAVPRAPSRGGAAQRGAAGPGVLAAGGGPRVAAAAPGLEELEIARIPSVPGRNLFCGWNKAVNGLQGQAFMTTLHPSEDGRIWEVCHVRSFKPTMPLFIKPSYEARTGNYQNPQKQMTQKRSFLHSAIYNKKTV
ncbi:transcription initiation factor TFIID subunit 4-like [Gallus gallus]|uniref:transcription initiation factor TFIID subunit 4-like n=1 Tax=Gallus gallus TaxID=9031 RepID=UPI001F011519|nr:transcription initiation factor TFIID subunit 4-like [Gallus gallus]XP_046765549.1 transcription initiation factor TFIID subunit 4-like [Gallus gallus]